MGIGLPGGSSSGARLDEVILGRVTSTPGETAATPDRYIEHMFDIGGVADPEGGS
jgi:hypothetical protein